MAKFQIREPRFMQLVGQMQPVYVEASVGKPAVVDIPDGFIQRYEADVVDEKTKAVKHRKGELKDRGLFAIDAPEEKLTPAHAIGVTTPVKKAAEASKTGGRAADK